MTSALVLLMTKVTRGLAETSLIELFGILGLSESESSLAKVGIAAKQMSELGLQIIPPVSQGELDSTRRVVFADSGLITIETFQEELANREAEALELKSSLMYDHKKASILGNVPRATHKSDEVLHSSLKTVAAFLTSFGLGDHLKTGQTLSVQNRPTGLAEDVIVLPCRSVLLQGADCISRCSASTFAGMDATAHGD